MMRIIAVFLIAFVCLFLSGCMKHMHGITHPHSDITAPTFCLYEGWSTKQDAKPYPIYRIGVSRMNKIDDEPFDWGKWEEYMQMRPVSDQAAWEIVYDPDGKSNPPEKPFACITYGKVPPGYIEKTPAQLLIPERCYTVLMTRTEGGPMSWGDFVIRADAQGRPTHLEYRMDPGPDNIFVITRQ